MSINRVKEHAQKLSTPQLFFFPAINRSTITNREWSEEDIEEHPTHYQIPMDLPLVVQISRYDRWKDLKGVIEAFHLARREVEATLVLLGSIATDDPGGKEGFESLRAQVMR